MVDWANGGYGGRVRFLMLCVETGDYGLSTAKSFGKQFRVPSTVLNAYIDSPSEEPTYGQLGCGGFIVLGLHGEFAAHRTVPAYLDNGPLALKAVETLLNHLGVESPEPPSWTPRWLQGIFPPARAPGGAGTAATPAGAEAKIVPYQPALVGNVEMDKEHADLAAVITALQQERSQSFSHCYQYSQQEVQRARGRTRS